MPARGAVSGAPGRSEHAHAQAGPLTPPVHDPLPTDAASARTAVARLAARLQAQGIGTMRAAPPEPTTCCGRGCNGCVWEGYLAAVGWWCEDARALLSEAGQPRLSAPP